MNAPVTVSIITVVFNDRENFLKTMESVLDQQMGDTEWIVVDGGSTDGTVDVLRTVRKPLFNYSSEPDAGIYDAMNKGISRAQGEFLIFMNAGDCFVDQHLIAKVTAIIRARPEDLDFVYGDAIERSESGHMVLKAARSHAMIWYGMFTHHQAMFYRRSISAELGFDTRFKIAGDYDFTARFLKRARRIERCHFPICIFSKGGVSERRQSVGRRENFEVQTQRLGVGHISAWGIQLLYLAAASVRSYLPSMYSVLRYRSTGK